MNITKRLIVIAACAIPAAVLAEEYDGGGSYSGAQGIGAAQSQSALINQSNDNYDSPDASDRAPTIFVPALAGGTNPCIVSWSAGASIGGTSGLPGLGFSGGNAYTDPECNVRETLRIAAALTPKEFASEKDRDASQAFLRSIACQSKVMAAAMEMTAREHGAKYGCINTLPEGTEVSMRPMLDRGNDVVMVTKARTDGTFQTQFAAEIDDGLLSGPGFVH